MTRIRFYIGTVCSYSSRAESGTGHPLRHYRVGKEAWQAIEAELVKTFGGWTLYYARGAWGSMVENSRVYEALTPEEFPADSLRALTREWTQLTGQESILWTQESVQGEFVSMAPPRVTMHSY